MTETARGSAEDHERAEARCFSTALQPLRRPHWITVSTTQAPQVNTFAGSSEGRTAHGRGRAEPAGFEREVFFLHGGDEILVLWPEMPQKIRGD